MIILGLTNTYFISACTFTFQLKWELQKTQYAQKTLYNGLSAILRTLYNSHAAKLTLPYRSQNLICVARSIVAGFPKDFLKFIQCRFI